MAGVVPITDSRWRDDITLYEEGDEPNAEQAKNRIETEQRRKRSLMEKGQLQHKPLFFEKIDHPQLSQTQHLIKHNEEKPIQYRLITGEKGYWERRKRGDWSDLPYLWGPPDEE